MPRKNWQQVKDTFHDALRHDSGERESFLNEACGGDIEFRIEVESLLISLAEAKNFLEQPVIGEVSQSNAWRLSSGQVISHYRIVSPIASGGMGEVYLAEDEQLRRRVALKILPEDLMASKDRLRRFQREAEVVSALNHPNILTIFEFGSENNIHLLASEFVEGETLRTRLSHAALSLPETLDIAIQIASALHAAHQAGVVHRDIKPENVMIRDDGYVKVLDFGLAKLTERVDADSKVETKRILSQPGVIMGTVTYMSPEQTRAKGIDARSDLFSLGVVIYEMLAGRVPFKGETTTDVIAEIIQKHPPPVRRFMDDDAPAELDRIIAKALEKDRSERYQTAADLLVDLKHLKKQIEMTATIGTEAETRENPSEHATEFLIERPTSLSAITETQPKSWHFPAAVIALLIAALAALGYWYFNSVNPTQIDSIAVMPFVNESGNVDVEYLSDGMTETLINSLSELPNLNVKARSSVFRYKGKDIELPKIGKELNVQAILTGRIVQRGDNLTLSWDLVDAKTERHIAGGQYNRKLADLVAIQSEIARDVSRKLGARLSGADEQKITKTYTANPEAYQLYLKGRFHTLKNTRPEHLRAIPHFEKAIAIDPNYALAYVGLADANRGLALAGEMRPTEYFPKAKAAAQRALEIDGKLAEAHAILGWITHLYNWDWAGAENHCKRALELDPDSGDAHIFYASILSSAGRHQEALAEAKRASELEPLNLRTNVSKASILIYAGQPDEALSILDKVLELDPNYWFAHQFAAHAYIEKGQFDKAKASARRGRELYDLSSRMISVLGYALAKSGKQTEARAELQNLLKLSTDRFISPYNIAILYNGLGESGEALKWLERGVEEREPRMVFLKVDPKLNNLRGDLRFQDLLRRVGFPQ